MTGTTTARAARERSPSALGDARILARLWPFVRPHQRWIWASLGLLLLIATCRLALPYLIKIAIDEHLTTGAMEGFTDLLVVFAAAGACEVIGSAFQTWTLDRAAQDALLDLRLKIFRHLQRLSSAFYDRTPIGRLIGRLTTDVEALAELFSSGVVTVLGDVIFLVAVVAILLSMSWQLTLVALCAVPVLLVLTLWVRTRVRSAYADMIARRSRMHAYLHEQVAGMSLIQAFVREGRSRQGFEEIAGGVRDAQLRSVRWESSLSAMTEMLGSFTLALILWYGGRLVLGDAGGAGSLLTLGALFAFVDYMQRLFVPLNDLSLKYTVLQNAITASERIFDLLDVDQITPEPEWPARLHAGRGAIEFRGVTFGYHPGETVLRDVSFRVEPGERVAIVGATGSGKTTLLKLLTRLYDIDSGEILLDGVDVRRLALRDLRRRVGIVPQDVFLFGGDVLSNVRLGHPEISEAQAVAAADRLHLDQVVQRFPRGYREPVRERGVNLSAGERQLIAFARVLAVAPPVLALDEATSNVDSHTERILQEAVHMILEGRTALIIAHRLSTVRDADRILVVERGELVEQGSHAELMALEGRYHRLVQVQFQEAGLEGVEPGD